MKHRITAIGICLMLTGLVFTATAEPIKVSGYDYPPLMGASKLGQDGVETEIIQAIFQAAGLEPSIKLFPRLRAMNNLLILDSPLYVGGITNFDKKDQANLFQIPTLLNINLLFYLKAKYPQFSFNSYADLKNYLIGLGIGSSPEKVAKENGLKYEAISEMDTLIKKLYVKHNDLVVMMDLAGALLINEIYPGREGEFASYTAKPFYVTQRGLVLNKNHPDAARLEPMLKKGLKTIYENGTWLRIMEKYYGSGKVPKDTIQYVANFVHEPKVEAEPAARTVASE